MGRICGSVVKASAFLLCLVSPVFHKLLCGEFKERATRKIDLPEIDKAEFQIMIDLVCGKEINEIVEISTLITVAELADRFALVEVVAMLDDIIQDRINVETCAQVLGKGAVGLQRVSHLGREVALFHFEQLSKSEGLSNLSSTELISLLEDNNLKSASEEVLFESILPWVKACSCNITRHQILRCIRFPLMDEKYLESIICSGSGSLSHGHAKLYALEAIQWKHSPLKIIEGFVFRYLGSHSTFPRKFTGVPWNFFKRGGEKRIGGTFMETLCIVECDGHMCSGDLDGSIRIWNKDTLELETTFFLENNGSVDDIEDDETQLSPWCDCVTSIERQLISGHEGGKIAVWDLSRLQCRYVLEGHTSHVRALVVSRCGTKLISGSDDYTIKIWTIGSLDALLPWPCERTMRGHRDSVKCLATYGESIVSGSSDSTIRVWDINYGVCVQTLRGHRGRVVALLVHDSKLFSSATDRTLKMWCAISWRNLCTIDMQCKEWQHIQCLAISGDKLVTGSASALHLSEQQRSENECEVKVWNLENFNCEYRFQQPAGQDVLAIVGTGGQVWAGVGSEIAVWAVNK